MHKTVKTPSTQTIFHQKRYKSTPAFTAHLPSDKIAFVRGKNLFVLNRKFRVPVQETEHKLLCLCTTTVSRDVLSLEQPILI